MPARNKTIDWNKYDKFLFILIVSLIFGKIGGAFTVTRIITILLVPYAVNEGAFKDKRLRPVVLLFCGLYFYSVFSLLWTPDVDSTSKTLVYLPVHMFYFVEIALFVKKSQNTIRTICFSWATAVIATSIIGIWEIETDNHLWLSIQGSENQIRDEGIFVLHNFASSTFANMNNYSTFLSASIPFIIYNIYQENYRFLRIVGLLAFGCAIFILSTNASRGGILCLLINLVCLLLFSMQRKSIKGVSFFLFLIAVFGVVVYLWGESLFYYTSLRMQSQSLVADEGREELIKTGLEVAFKDYYGLGAGAGSAFAAMHNHIGSARVWATHNFFLEIIVEYGVLFFIIIYYLFVLFRKGYKNGDAIRRMVIVSAFFTMFPMSVINSGYLGNEYIWAFYSSLFVIAYEHLRYIRQVSLQTT